MESSIGEIRNLFALLNCSNPDIIQPYKSRIANQHIVAAKLIAANQSYEASAVITAIDDKKYTFLLNLTSRTYQSKGDWIWVKQIEVIYSSVILISIPVNPHVIDIPYTGNRVCAHWLFRNIDKELNETLNKQL